MAAKELFFGDESKKKLMGGIEKVAKAVQTTLGPCGRNVMFQNGTNITVTKDGVTVAKNIELEDPVENLGAALIKQVAAKTNEVAGDNTTTSTVLAHAIVKEGMKAISAGMLPTELKKGIDFAVKQAVEKLEGMSKPVETEDEITNVATISANNDPEIGKILAEAVNKVGKDGVITVEESPNMTTSVEVVEGLQISNGWLNPNMCNNKERLEVDYDDCYVLVTDKQISGMGQILKLLEAVIASGKPLTIICDDMDGEALGTIILNDIRGSLKTNVVKAPSFGSNKKDILGDIAALTGAEIISDDYGRTLESATIDLLGTAKVKSTKNETIITNGGSKPGVLEARINELKGQIEAAKEDYDKNKLKARLAKLTGGVAVVKVGAATEVELKEKKFRVDDTIAATRAALEEGIVPGGGVALLESSMWLDVRAGMSNDYYRGVNIVVDAMRVPLKSIAENSGINGEVVLSNIMNADKKGWGYNALTEEYCDMMSSGIIDTTKAIKNALINAASVAAMILTTECTITDIPKKEEPLIASPVGPLPM